MGNYRVLRWIGLVVLVGILVVPVSAYDNKFAHPYINIYAIDYFERQIMPFDPVLKTASLHGVTTRGYAWDWGDKYSSWTGPRESVNESRRKPLVDWIEDGGYTADEPEATMGLVHFYDPNNGAELTDTKWYQDFATWAVIGKKPKISAEEWTFDICYEHFYAKADCPSDGSEGPWFIQNYSWTDAQSYLYQGISSREPQNPYYGQAWRAVGETMHMISDMTVPAHVRNDGHMPFTDPDVYESLAMQDKISDSYKQVKAGSLPPAPIDYDKGSLKEVFHNVAMFTNKNFMTDDTSPLMLTSTNNMKKITYRGYEYPKVTDSTPDQEGYIWRSIDGRPFRIAKTTKSDRGGISWWSFNVDENVIADQQKILIPTAIRASAEVLDRFLPRFDVKLSAEKYPSGNPADDRYIVRIKITQVPGNQPYEGQLGIPIRNGGHLVTVTPSGERSDQALNLDSAFMPSRDPTFNDWQEIYQFKPGTKLSAYFDLGGYVVRSNEFVVPEPNKVPGDSSKIKEGSCRQIAWGDGEYTVEYFTHGYYGGFVQESISGRPEVSYEFTMPDRGEISLRIHESDVGGTYGWVVGDVYRNNETQRGGFCVNPGDTVKFVAYPYPYNQTIVNERYGEYWETALGPARHKWTTVKYQYHNTSSTICIDRYCTSPDTCSGCFSPVTTAITTPVTSVTPITVVITTPVTRSTSATPTTRVITPVSSPPTSIPTTVPLVTTTVPTTSVPATYVATITRTTQYTTVPTTVKPTLPPTTARTTIVTSIPTTVPLVTTTVTTVPATAVVTTMPPTTTNPTTQATQALKATVSGVAVVMDWDKTGDSFSFKSGVCSGCGFNAQGSDLFIADRKADSIIHVFDAPGIIDMGEVPLSSITVAPPSGYVDDATPLLGHSYVIHSRGVYGKIRILQVQASAAGSGTKYSFEWVYQPDGSANFGS